MMRLSQTTIYAVQALSCMPAAGTQTCLVRDLAETTGVPKPYLAKIINQLNHRGLIYAKRGYRGGIALSRPPEKISLLEVVEAVEGKNWISKCLLETGCCEAPEDCPTGQRWTKVRANIKKMLHRTTLADAKSIATFKPGVPRIIQPDGRRPRGRRPALAFKT